MDWVIEYFSNGNDGDILFASDLSGAVYEARERMKIDGATWCGLIAVDREGNYCGSWSLTLSGGLIAAPEDEYEGTV